MPGVLQTECPRFSDVNHDLEIATARVEAAVKRIDPADLAHEAADLIAGELDEEAGPFTPLIREILANPPVERLGSRYYSFIVSPAILREVGRRVQALVEVAFDTAMQRELARLDVA